VPQNDWQNGARLRWFPISGTKIIADPRLLIPIALACKYTSVLPLPVMPFIKIPTMTGTVGCVGVNCKLLFQHLDPMVFFAGSVEADAGLIYAQSDLCSLTSLRMTAPYLLGNSVILPAPRVPQFEHIKLLFLLLSIK
jgi:hypothetical protein